jgi:hypothetical protein
MMPWQECYQMRELLRLTARLPFQIKAPIVHLRQEHPSSGAPKIHEKIDQGNLRLYCL